MSTSHLTTSRNPGRKSALVGASAPAAKPGPIAAAASQAAPRQPVDPETRRMMIAEAAYYCAEKRGFAHGGELQDWLEAEARMEALLRA